MTADECVAKIAALLAAQVKPKGLDVQINEILLRKGMLADWQTYCMNNSADPVVSTVNAAIAADPNSKQQPAPPVALPPPVAPLA